MKHLLGYKLFESDETYTSVSISSMYSSLGTSDNSGDLPVKYKKISDSTIKKILAEFPNLSVGEMNPQYFHKACCTTFYEIDAVSADGNLVQSRFDIDIYESDDEWFFVEFHILAKYSRKSLGGHNGIYKCDQLHGLFDCITNIILSLDYLIVSRILF